MAQHKYCECCAANNSILIDMKTEEFECDGKKIYIIDMYKKILKVFVEENLLNDLSPEPQICDMCVVQLESAYVFINLCKTTLVNKPFKVKLEPPDEETIIDDDMPPASYNRFHQINEPKEQQTRFDTLFIASDYPVDVKLEPDDNKSKEENFLTKSKMIRDPIEDPDYKPDMHEMKQEPSENEMSDNEDYYNPDSREFQCTICYKVFKTRDTLRSHKKVHSDDVPYECYYCGFKTRHRSSLLKHMEQHKGDAHEFIFHCDHPDCTAKFKTVVQLGVHMEQHYNVDGKYTCTICQKEYSTKKNLRQHQKLHGDRNYACDVCGSTFAEQCRLTEHQKIHTDQKEYSCELCNKSFRLKYTLDVHVKRHNSEWLYHCNFCEKGFVLRHDWVVHEDKHRNEQQFECSVCEKKFNAQKNLRTHMLIHSQEKTLQCQWEGCTKMYRDERSRRVHFEKHTLDRAFECEICKKGFKTAVYLRVHVSNVHNKIGGAPEQRDQSKKLTVAEKIMLDKPFACDRDGCKKRFRDERSRQIHLMRHDGEMNPYQCNMCNKWFSSASNLKSHINRIHDKNMSTIDLSGEISMRSSVDLPPLVAPVVSKPEKITAVVSKTERVVPVKTVKEVGSSKSETAIKIKMKSPPTVAANVRPQEKPVPAKVTKASNESNIKKLLAEFHNLKSHIFGTQEKTTPTIDISCSSDTIVKPPPVNVAKSVTPEKEAPAMIINSSVAPPPWVASSVPMPEANLFATNNCETNMNSSFEPPPTVQPTVYNYNQHSVEYGNPTYLAPIYNIPSPMETSAPLVPYPDYNYGYGHHHNPMYNQVPMPPPLNNHPMATYPPLYPLPSGNDGQNNDPFVNL